MQATNTETRMIPISALVGSARNVRKAETPANEDAELRASILGHGLIHNLNVRPLAGSATTYEVVGGRRRLRALEQLVKAKALDKDHLVPCRVLSDDAADEEISLAENVCRSAMHPVDEYEAFAALIADGTTPANVAERFGVSERTVERRMRLGGLAEEILEALRKDEISLDTAKAFTLTVDTERQLAAYKAARESFSLSAHTIERMLTDEQVNAASPAARYVGLAAYEKAGGNVMRDLFADDDPRGVWLTDRDLVIGLAEKKLQKYANRLMKTWKWATAQIDLAWEEREALARMEPTAGTPTEEETAEIIELEAELEAQGEPDGTSEDGEEQIRRWNEVNNRLSEIEQAVKARRGWTDEQQATGGCMVTINHAGQVELHEGLVRPEDMPTPKDTVGPEDADNAGGEPHEPPPDLNIRAALMRGPAQPSEQDAALKEAGVGRGLSEDLQVVRLALIKAAGRSDFDVMFDLTLYTLARNKYGTRNYLTVMPVDVQANETSNLPAYAPEERRKLVEGQSPGIALLAESAPLPLSWLEAEDEQASFDQLAALPRTEKERLFAALTADTLKPQLGFAPRGSKAFERAVERLGIDFSEAIRPSAKLFWLRVPKARMLEIAGETLGELWVSEHKHDKKAPLAAAMDAAFAAGEHPDQTPEQLAAVQKWSLPGFTPFDERTLGDEADAQAPSEGGAGNNGEGNEKPDEPIGEASDVPAFLQSKANGASTDKEVAETGSGEAH